MIHLCLDANISTHVFPGPDLTSGSEEEQADLYLQKFHMIPLQ